MNRLLVIAFATLFSGCAYQLQMMPRDSGKVYTGSVSSNGFGSGTLNVSIEGRSCKGPFVTSASGNSFGIAQTYGTVGTTPIYGSTVVSTYGASRYKAMLSCSDGSGIQCDVQGAESGAGVCVDSNNRVYDLIYK